MKYMQISAYVHSMSMITTDFVSGEIFVCDVMLTKLYVHCVRSLLWETLTGREHLMFYGRMKNLTGAALTQVV
jgi:hypothetical protein